MAVLASVRLAVTAVSLSLAPAAAAQTVAPAPTATIRGVVRGEMSRVLRDADVLLDGDSVHVRTGPEGRFRFDQVTAGPHWLFVRAIGYAPTRRLVTVSPDTNEELTVRLMPAPYVLPDVEVRAQSDRDLRRLMGWTRNAWGYSVSEEQIRRFGNLGLSVIVRTRLPWQATSWFDRARQDVTQATDIFGKPYAADGEWNGLGRDRWSAGVWLTGSDRPDRQLLGTGCAPAVSINGERPWSETHLDDIAPDGVASMEIYQPKRRGGHAPADFTFFPQVIQCGLVVVWLR